MFLKKIFYVLQNSWEAVLLETTSGCIAAGPSLSRVNVLQCKNEIGFRIKGYGMKSVQNTNIFSINGIHYLKTVIQVIEK